MLKSKMFFLGIMLFQLLITYNIYADDIEIFGGAEISVPPNILIILDNSGSMNDTVEVIVDPYDPETDYSGGKSRSKVYYKKSWWWSWYEFENIGADEEADSGEIKCESARNALNESGNWSGSINDYGSHTCPGRYYLLRTGNYFNYLETIGSTSRKKILIAQDVLNELLDDERYASIRFGLMVFNYHDGSEYYQGGHVVATLGTPRATIKTRIQDVVDNMRSNQYTPLAETLAEAGLFFARKQSWCNPSTSSPYDYNTHDLNSDGKVDFDDWPVKYRCQKNYIIVMTDGASTKDCGTVLTRDDYMLGHPIKDYDNDGHEPGYSHARSYSYNGSDYLDDVAGFLYDYDLLTSVADTSGVSFDNPDFNMQNIVTYTIGFDIDDELLSEAAANGRGRYFTTKATGGAGLGLTEIFGAIIGEILETSSEFVAPVVPVNRINRTYADKALYLGLFSPSSSGLWKGNLKKFGLESAKDDNGDYYLMVLDKDGNDATDVNGNIKNDAISCWNAGAGLAKEGLIVDKGGVGLKLMNATRSFLTYKAEEGMLTFNKDNLTASDLALSTDAERDDLVDFVTASGIYAPDSGDDKQRQWIMGDIMHSKPAISYDLENDKNIIYVGANDGFLHCFVDSDKGTSDNLSDDEISEQWAFIPWELVPNLQYLPSKDATTEITGDSNHDWFVDGSPVVFENSGSSYVMFGLRRGGSGYYCLNVDNYSAPVYQWGVSNSIGSETLGQSWSEPNVCTIKGIGGTSEIKAIFLTGGYDTNQDNDDPGAGDTKGRAVFAINAGSGAVTSNMKFYYGDNGFGTGYMDYCIVDLVSYDDDEDGCDDVVYAGDLGGNLFVFNDKDNNGSWVARRLFDAENDGGTDKLRKLPNSPGITQETWGDYVFIGSGDREHPLETETCNRFFAIKNTWPQTGDYSNDNPLKASDLTDVTDDYLQGSSVVSAYTRGQYETHLSSILENGWYIDMIEINGSEIGEKVVSTPIIYNGIVFFTTFIPSYQSTSDPCASAAGFGTARLWAVDYKTGNAVFEHFDGDPSKLTREDRYVGIGGGIPSDPVIIVTAEGTFIGVGTQGSPQFVDSGDTKKIHRYFWMKQF